MIKNLKYTAGALALAATLSITGSGCGKDSESVKTLETEETTKNLKTEEELRDEIYNLEKELKEVQEANYEENFEIVHTLSNLSGVDISSHDDGRIFKIQVMRNQTEKDFITILNCLKSSTCYDLCQLEIKNCDLTKYSEETRNLFKDVMSNLATVELEDLVLANMNITDISFLSNRNFENTLRSLDLSHNQISDISILKYLNLHEMDVIFLDFNQITDITSISHLKNISIISFNNNNISDISALLDLPELNSVFLRGNNILDFSVEEKLKSEGVLVLPSHNQNSSEIEEKNGIRLELGKEYEFKIGDDINLNIGNNKIKVKTEDGKVKVKVR